MNPKQIIEHFISTDKMKYLIIGSAPYVSQWIAIYLPWFIENDYKIICFNNSWKLVEFRHIYQWHSSDNFIHRGTFIPTDNEITKFREVIIHKSDKEIAQYYVDFKGGTMFLNTLYYLLHFKKLEKVVVIGCDMIYSKKGDTFYSDLKISKASNDPINKWGEKGLNNELMNSLNQFKKHNVTILNASENDTRLLYPKFRHHLQFSDLKKKK